MANGSLVPSPLISKFHGVSKALLPSPSAWLCAACVPKDIPLPVDSAADSAAAGSAAAGSAAVDSAAAVGLARPRGKRSVEEAELADARPSSEEGSSSERETATTVPLIPEICLDVAREYEGATSSSVSINEDAELDEDSELWAQLWALDARLRHTDAAEHGHVAPPSLPPSPPICTIPSSAATGSWLLRAQTTRAATLSKGVSSSHAHVWGRAARAVWALLNVAYVVIVIASTCTTSSSTTAALDETTTPEGIPIATPTVSMHDVPSCPTGWLNVHAAPLTGPVAAAKAAPRCFHTTREFGTHDECATRLCPNAVAGEWDGGGGRSGRSERSATLARIWTRAEAQWLIDTLVHGADVWIGLYADPDAPDQRSKWRWVSDEGNDAQGGGSGTELPPLSHTGPGVLAAPVPNETVSSEWQDLWHGQPDARYGREDCAYLSGGTGEWDDYGCDLREFRCLCELGVSPSPSYMAAVRAHAEARAVESKGPRMCAALLLGGLMALPLAYSESGITPLARLFSRCTAKRGGECQSRLHDASWHAAERTTPPSTLSWARPAAAALGSAMLFGGTAPFLYHHIWGGWTALQLGPWVNYVPFATAGGFLLLETVPPRPIRLISLSIGALFATVCAGCTWALITNFELSRLWQWVWQPTRAAASTTHLDRVDGPLCAGVFVSFGIVYGFGACKTWHQAIRPHRSPHAMYAAAHDSGRFVAGMCGQVLLLIYCAPLALLNPHVFGHSYAPGAAVTALSFMLIGFACSRENCERLLGAASNEQQLERS